MSLHVHYGPRLAPLADDWAERIAAPLPDPFAAEVVAVPTAGVRDWLSRHLATRLGVAANIDMPFPGRFIATALELPVDDDDPWSVERLAWTVLAALESGAVEVPGWHHAAASGPSRRYAVARRIADLFDRYAANRPELLQQWRNGAPGDGTVRTHAAGGAAAGGDDDELLVGPLDPSFEWQFHLWRLVREEIGRPSPAEQLPDLLAALRGGRLDPELPERVGWFGTSTVPPARLAVLSALAHVRDVHLYVVHPSPAGWTRVVAQLPGRPVPRRRDAASAAASLEGHPLLRSWGRSTAELAALVQGCVVVEPGGVTLHEVVIGADGSPAFEGPTTLLRHLQADIVADRPPTPFVPGPDDTSIQVHACHGVTRQLEVLRDVLGHLFAADPALQPSDVLVLCPDLDRFQPFAEAVFGRGRLPVPLAVTDLSLGTDNPVAAVLADVIRIAGGRCTSLDVLGLVGLEPVRRRLGLSIEDVDVIGSWIARLGTSWGLDADHRTPWLGDVLADGTWAATVQSLLLGAAMPAEEPRQGPGGVVPHDDVGPDAFATAGRLAELLARLGRMRALLAVARPMPEWCDVLVEALALFCAVDAPDAWQVAAVTAAIDDVRTAAAAGASAVDLAASDLGAVVEHLVTDRRGRLRLRTGSVTLTGFVPVRDVPAEVVAVVGFDEVSLRPPSVDGDDLLAVRPCLGEPDRRAERRQLFLDALLAAGRHFIVICDGSDVTTNRRVRFPVQLAELLDVVDAVTSSGSGPDRVEGGTDPAVVVRHPLRSYDEANFGGDGGSPFGFDDAMRSAAVTRRATDDQPLAAGRGPVDRWSIGRDVGPAVPTDPDPTPPVVTLSQLAQACSRPARTLLREGLDIRLPGEVVEPDTLIPIGVSRLESAGAGGRLLARLRAAARDLRPSTGDDDWAGRRDEVVEQWRRAESLAGRLPPRALSRHALDAVAAEVAALAELAGSLPDLAPHAFLGASGAVDVDLVLDAARLHDTVHDVVATGSGRTICRAAYTRHKPRHDIAAVLDLAAVVVVTEDATWEALSIARSSRTGGAPECWRLVPRGSRPLAAALRLLEVAAALHREARREAIPLFEKSSAQLHTEHFIDEDMFLPTDFGGADLDDPDTAFVWGSVPVAEILGMAPGPLEYADRLWGAVGQFADVSRHLPTTTTRTPARPAARSAGRTRR